MFVTTTQLSLNAWGTQIELPSGSKVVMVKQLDGLRGDGFVVADTKQLIELTGNAHDPKYRYLTVPAVSVSGETDQEIAVVERIRTVEKFAGLSTDASSSVE